MTGSYDIKPTLFGKKYVLLNHIKSGGMAEVWLGRMVDSERPVAIKRILPHIAKNPDFINMFIDEAKITAQLQHANICKVYALEEDLEANSYYIVMEYIHGRDLRTLFDGCARNAAVLPMPVSCYVMASCCDGLNYAHCRKDAQEKEMKIVHRDVSLQNILVGFDGSVKLIDFGIAKAADRITTTVFGTLKGKISYMSPEQAAGAESEKIDRRSDVFGIGICLYELLTGKRLFVGKREFEILEKVKKAEVALPTSLNRDIPLELEKIVMKALARNVEERYQHASELGDALWNFLYGLEGTFGSRSLAEYMQTSFAKAYAEEQQHLQEYLTAPIDMDSSDEYETSAGQTGERYVLQELSDNERTIVFDTQASQAGMTERHEVVSEEEAEEVAAAAEATVFSPPPSLPPSPAPTAEIALPSERELAETRQERKRPKAPEAPLSPGVSSELAATTQGVFLERLWHWLRGPEPGEEPSLWRKYLWVWGVVLVAVLAAGGVLAWPSPMGNVLVEVPSELAGEKVQLFVNGKEVLDEDGGPIRVWPRRFRVPAGKIRISMLAEGYKPLTEELEIPEGQRYVRLQQTLQKQMPSPPPPPPSANPL